MMKDMKWKQIDTTYAGKAYQVEAEEINLHGEVNIQGDLKVNGGSISTPTASGTTYDNTVSGLTGDDVQEAVDELATYRIKVRNFDNLTAMCSWLITNYTVKPLSAYSDNGLTWDVSIRSNNTVNLSTIARLISSPNSMNIIVLMNDGTTSTGWEMRGNATPTALTTAYDNFTYQLVYIG